MGGGGGRAHGQEPAPGWPTNLLLKAQGTEEDCPHKKAVTLLPSFTMTPTATESTASPTTSHRPTTTSHGNVTVHTSSGPTTVTHNPATTTSHGNATISHATVSPTTNGTATSPRSSTVGPHPGPPPPSPSPRSKGALGNYTWANGSQPCVQLQAQIQIRILYPIQGGRKVKLKWGLKRARGKSWARSAGKRKRRGGDKLDGAFL